LSRSHPINPDAEIALAKAAYFKNNQRTPEGAREAVAYSQQAVKIDPDSAPAYAALSESYALTIFMTAEKRSEVLSLAKAAAERALALDGQLEAAHAVEAEISCAFEWDWPRCEQEVRLALELNPNDAGARETLANYLAAIGRTDEAVAEAKRARTNNPLSILANRDVGRHLYFAGKYDEAIAELNRTAELDPKSHIIFGWIGLASLEKGMADRYIAMLLRQHLNDGSSAEVVGALQAAYAEGGLEEYWSVALAAALRKQHGQGRGAEYSLAVLNAHLGNKDQAFEWLEEGYRQRSYSLTWIKVDPQLASLRPDSRFGVLLSRIGLR
jgi:tetratricopeptide (TPR) repeat protein